MTSVAQPGPRRVGASARPTLSLVFPARNEEPNIDELLRAAGTQARRLARDFEVVVVDDGSRDDTARRVIRAGLRDGRIRLVRHTASRGYGAALRAGLREARGELVFFSDADLQFDLAELARLLDHTDSFDIVAGYRAPRRDPLGRRLIARLWGGIVRALFGLRVRDIDCAFKVFRREVIEAMPIASIGAFVNTEILVRALAGGYRIHQVPVSHQPRRHGRQTGAHPRVIVRAVVELLSLYRELRHLRRRTHSARSPETGPALATRARG